MINVTPNLDHAPKRTYKRDGKVINCHTVKSYLQTGTGVKLVLDPIPDFSITLNFESTAIKLMEDLYYGEYTGG